MWRRVQPERADFARARLNSVRIEKDADMRCMGEEREAHAHVYFTSTDLAICNATKSDKKSTFRSAGAHSRDSDRQHP
jgi:hypothetical protein